MNSENTRSVQAFFDAQKQFSKKLFEEQYGIDIDNMTKEDKVKYSKEYILSASKELMEALDELPWKKHRFMQQNNNEGNFIEEIVDSFKFIVNLMLINGFTADDFTDKFFIKSKIVQIRYEQETALKKLQSSNEKVAVIDIDGVLNNYPLNFVDFFQSNGFEYEDIKTFKLNDFANYSAQKHCFRAQGHEANGKLVKGVNEKLKNIQKNHKIVLLTARPYEEYSRLFSDTVQWLEDNEVPYDFIFFSKNKEEWLLNNFKKEQIALVVDDQINNVTQLMKYFSNVFLVKNENLYTSSDYENMNKDIKLIDSLVDVDNV